MATEQERHEEQLRIDRKKESEGTLTDLWKKKKKHIFIFTNSGKPVYSRYGDESKLAGLIGVLVGLVSFVERTDDEIVWVRAGSHRIVFYAQAPLYCAMIADTAESEVLLKRQLQYMHSQILSILTETANKVLRDNPRFDLRNLLTGTDRFASSFMNRLAADVNRNPQYLLNSIQCLRVPSTLRAQVGSILQTQKKGDSIFYALLMARGYLVSLVRPKKHILYPPDLHLLINFIASSASFRSSEATLTPICLPLFNRHDSQLFMAYLTPDICLLLLTTQSDAVTEIRESKEMMLTALSAPPNALQQVQTITSSPTLSGSHFYPVSELGVPDLLHFLYKSHNLSQMTSPHATAPFHNKTEFRRLFRHYQRIERAVHLLEEAEKPHKVYYERLTTETFVAWVTKEFDLYACFSPFVSKSDAIKGCNVILKWIKQEEPSLFLLSSPIW